MRQGTDPFSTFDDMFAGRGLMLAPFDSSVGGCGALRLGQMGMAGGREGTGRFSSQTMMFSSAVGGDGRVRSERFASSSVGDFDKKIAETQQAYSNSATGVDKMSLERQMRDRARKMVKEQIRGGDERQTQMFRGMDEAQAAQFDQHWEREAVPNLPSHFKGVPAQMAFAPEQTPQLFNCPQHNSQRQVCGATAHRPMTAQLRR